ncbi:MAG: DUF1638 domain-containing protein [Deltaproteobacteria bacterium]|nr:DUF1638 domain-containing protein [Deltaproteobacteria bacterium]
MNTVIIACRTIAEELRVALGETACPFPVLWIESGLHIKPDSLKTRLQEELDHIGNVGQVLLAFGYCGNALLGLRAGGFQLIFPRVDDCITLMLGSGSRRQEIGRECGTYFLTKGWLDYERNIWMEYQETVKRHGKERTDRIFKTMLRHYRRLGVIDTGAYDLDGFLERVRDIGAVLALQTQVIPGTLAYLKKLLTGPWDEDFITIHPGETVTVGHIYGSTAVPASKTATPQLTPFTV